MGLSLLPFGSYSPLAQRKKFPGPVGMLRPSGPGQITALEKSWPWKEEAPGKPGLPHRWGYGAVRPPAHQLTVLGQSPSPLSFLSLAESCGFLEEKLVSAPSLLSGFKDSKKKKRKDSPPLADARCPPLGGWGFAPVLRAGGLVASPARNKPFVKTAPKGPVFPLYGGFKRPWC